jgi:hypothetical protein
MIKVLRNKIVFNITFTYIIFKYEEFMVNTLLDLRGKKRYQV